MPRYFTLQRAQDALDDVRRWMEDAVEARASLARAEAELRRAAGRVQMLGGVRLDPARMAGLAQEREQSAKRIQERLERIHELGAQVKDLDTGLLDFPTLYRGREVLLCWKLGEPGIKYWHGLEEGFRGRKPIDRDFLDNHAGDEEH
jgi:hypothetical protein